MKIKVSKKPDGQPEIFFSIQGEGINIGKPAIFLRLGHCNLRCVWCDSNYTWDWTKYSPEDQLVEMSPEDIERELSKYDCKFLVVTGGEPLLQQDSIKTILKHLKSKGSFIEFETNGTLLPDDEILDIVDHWSVSPKLLNSGNALSLREVPECYRLFAGLDSSHFKYIVRDEDDLTEIHALAKKYKLFPDKVILMPEAKSTIELSDRSDWLVEACKVNGYRFSTRLHILLWGNQRSK